MLCAKHINMCSKLEVIAVEKVKQHTKKITVENDVRKISDFSPQFP